MHRPVEHARALLAELQDIIDDLCAMDEHFLYTDKAVRHISEAMLTVEKAIHASKHDTPTPKGKRIWQTPRGSVCLRTEDDTGDEVIREFALPIGSDFVRERIPGSPSWTGSGGMEVYYGLEPAGWFGRSGRRPLIVSDRDHLLDRIRQEYNRVQRQKRKLEKEASRAA